MCVCVCVCACGKSIVTFDIVLSLSEDISDYLLVRDVTRLLEMIVLPVHCLPFPLPGMMLLDHQGYLPGAGMMLPMVPVQSKGLSSDGQPGSDPNSPPPLQGEELRKLLLQQLEYYFSKDNLSSDKYLCKLPTSSLL